MSSPHLVGPLLGYLERRLRSRSESVLAQQGLRPRHVMTLTMLRTQGACAQQALTSMLDMDGTNVVGLLNELEAANLVERRRSPQDRRRHVVELTAAGAHRLAEVERALADVERDVLLALDPTQREHLYQLLYAVVGAVEAICPDRT